MADSDDSEFSGTSSDIVQDPLDLAESWEGDEEDLDVVENIVRDKMRGQIRDKPLALKMCIAILKRGIDEPFHRARFNLYISLLSENRLNLGISWLKDAEKVATARQKKSIHQFKQTMMSAKRKLVDMDTPGRLLFMAMAAHHTHSHTHDHSHDHDHDPAHSALSPILGLDGTSKLSPAGLDSPSESPATDMGRDDTKQPHPDLSVTSTGESNEDHEPSAAEVAARERLVANIAALKEGRTKQKNLYGSLGRLPKGASRKLAYRSFSAGEGPLG
ncbi:hypothetical protein LTR56_025419 [Elasticomyces elasticus]|nr:hypothetical protein LTR56_025419 [Elasticomyces elasticus]KAK3620914.1 hypothetical protein LTR22_025417 [Elasticomyces elasticus]